MFIKIEQITCGLNLSYFVLKCMDCQCFWPWLCI